MFKMVDDKLNKRLKIFDKNGIVNDKKIKRIHTTAQKELAEKIIVTAGTVNWKQYLGYGYRLEGIIDYYFKGKPAYILAYYLLKERSINPQKSKEKEILSTILGLKEKKSKQKNLDGIVRSACEKDAEEMAKIFRIVFESYPTPLHDSSYIKKIMKENVKFKIVVVNGRIVSAASADFDLDSMSAEMTDCATLPEFRGQGHMELLISELEKDMKDLGIITVYSLARSLSIGISKVFKSRGYKFRGRLINNCHICGQFENMNIWVKKNC